MSKEDIWQKKNDIKPKYWQEKNTFWATPQHYSCSYLAMFPPELPHYFIERFTEKGDIVLDPFCGRGTTPLQAMSQKRHGIGNDWNDLAYILTKGKLANPGIGEVIERIDDLERNYNPNDWKWPKGPHKIKMIFDSKTLSQLNYLKKEVDWKNNSVDAFIGMVLMGAMHGSSSGFLSISMPNTFSMSPNYIKKYINEKNLKREERNVFEVIRKRAKRYLEKGKLLGKGDAIYGNVRDLRENDVIKLMKDSVKLIFTSPPYLKVIKYGLYNWIRLWWLIDDYKEVDEKLDDGHSINPYYQFMKETLETLVPILDKENGMICLVIGDVDELNLAAAVWENVASKIKINGQDGEIFNLKKLAIIDDKIPDSEKMTKIWNAEEDKSGKTTKIDRILIMCHQNAVVNALIPNSDLKWEQIVK
jgi:site-specific DNA-methyltransferase (adenine-specific)